MNFLSDLPEELISIIIEYLSSTEISTLLRSIDIPDIIFKKLVYQRYKPLGITYISPGETWTKVYILLLGGKINLYIKEEILKDSDKFIFNLTSRHRTSDNHFNLVNALYFVRIFIINDFHDKYTYIFDKFECHSNLC
jgi:hypothetical protein